MRYYFLPTDGIKIKSSLPCWIGKGTGKLTLGNGKRQLIGTMSMENKRFMSLKIPNVGLISRMYYFVYMKCKVFTDDIYIYIPLSLKFVFR